MRRDISIRPETLRDYQDIISLLLRSFSEGTDYSDGTDVLALVEEIRGSEFYIPQLSFVAQLEGKTVGHFMFSRFPLSATPTGGHGGAMDTELVMLAPVAVHADFLRQGIGAAMLTLGLDAARDFGFKAATLEGDYHFYNRLGFQTSADFGIYPTSGRPLEEPRFMMCRELRPGGLAGMKGYVVYDMYCNA